MGKAHELSQRSKVFAANSRACFSRFGKVLRQNILAFDVSRADCCIGVTHSHLMPMEQTKQTEYSPADTFGNTPAADAPGTGEATPEAAEKAVAEAVASLPPEVGGQAGPEPTRYGDWENKGRCTDF